MWNSNAAPVTCLFQNKVMFLLEIMLIYDQPLLSGPAPLSGHLPVPRGWPRLVQTVRDTLECIPYSVSLEYDNEPVVQKTAPVFEVFTMVNLSFFPSILTHLTTHCFSSHSLVICYKAIKTWRRGNISRGVILLSVFLF